MTTSNDYDIYSKIINKDIVDKFWLDEPSILLRKDRFIEFYVSCDMSISERLNAITRFFIYISIILSLYFNNPKYLLIIILGLVITLLIYKGSKEKFNTCDDNINTKDPEIFNGKYTEPTLDNPFMNPSVLDPKGLDSTGTKGKPPAMDYSSRTKESLEIKNKIKSAFEYNLYQDVGDLYSSQNSFRDFYTVPDTTGNTGSGFKEFLYGNMKSAKENTYNGFKNLYEPLQAKRNVN